jgi:hypothetical protein
MLTWLFSLLMLAMPAQSRPAASVTFNKDVLSIFDNLYAVGNSDTTVYALTTSEGLVLLDAGFASRS